MNHELSLTIFLIYSFIIHFIYSFIFEFHWINILSQNTKHISWLEENKLIKNDLLTDPSTTSKNDENKKGRSSDRKDLSSVNLNRERGTAVGLDRLKDALQREIVQ